MRLLALLLLIVSLPSYAGLQRYGDAIIDAARTVGVNPVTLAIIANVETNFSNVRANAPKSTAEGLFQFTDTTWRHMLVRHGEQYGIPLNTSKYDYRANALMAALYLKHNQEMLRDLLKREPTPAELYLAHFLGTSGVRTLMTAKTSLRASQVVAYAYPNNRPLFVTRDGRHRTVGQFRDHMNQRFTALYEEYEEPVSRMAWGHTEPVRHNPFTPIKDWLKHQWALIDVNTLTAQLIALQVEG